MHDFSDAYEMIVKYLRDELRVPDSITISPESSVTRSLKVDGDDLSFLLVPDLEKLFGKKLGNERWAGLETVEQIARAFSED